MERAPLHHMFTDGWISSLLGVIVGLLLWKLFRSVFHTQRVIRYFNKIHKSRHDTYNKGVKFGPSQPSTSPPRLSNTGSLTVVSWNIEFGYKLSDIISRLKALRPDIILLQEADCFDDGEGLAIDVPKEISTALGFYFVHMPHHAYKTNGGRGKGVWGNAILSSFPIHGPTFLELNHIAGYPRSALTALVEIPSHKRASISCDECGDAMVKRLSIGRGSSCSVEESMGTLDQRVRSHSSVHLLVTSVHLEVCCGLSHRWKQFQQVVDHVNERLCRNVDYQKEIGLCSKHLQIPRVIIGGDLNTNGHGLVRLSPFHCTDAYRFRYLGKTEAQYWDQVLIPQVRLGPSAGGAGGVGGDRVGVGDCDSDGGGDGDGDMVITVKDHFHKVKDSTYQDKVVDAKMDWLLCDTRIEVLDRSVGKGTESDHYWVSKRISLDSSE